MIAAKAFQIDAETVERYRESGINLEKSSEQGHHLLPVPTVFLIGTDAVIDFQYVNPNYKVCLDPEMLLEAALFALKDDRVKLQGRDGQSHRFPILPLPEFLRLGMGSHKN